MSENYLIGKIDVAPMDQRLQSYLGMLSHANQHTLSLAIKNAYWVRKAKNFPVKKPALPVPKPKNKKTMT